MALILVKTENSKSNLKENSKKRKHEMSEEGEKKEIGKNEEWKPSSSSVCRRFAIFEIRIMCVCVCWFMSIHMFDVNCVHSALMGSSRW